MTMTSINPRRIALTVATVVLAGCGMDVRYPTVVDAGTFDPSQDAATLSLSAQSNLYRAVWRVVPFSAFFSQEAWVGAVRQETNDVGRRVATAGTSDVNSEMWTPLQRSLATNELTVDVLRESENASANIHLARALMNSGFSLVLLAEHFCQGTIRTGPPLTPAQMLDTAIARFTQAIAVGAAASAAGTAEGAKVVSAANVGLARAHLQKKEYGPAASAASLVPDDFVYNAVAVDDPSNRALANGLVFYDQNAVVIVPPAYRDLNDPRVPWRDAAKKTQDTQFEYYQQLKYTSFASPIRIASGLEARYIAAEAALGSGDPSTALALIAERRSANGQPDFTGSTPAEVLAELMDQRAREFWLEAKHVGDMVRNQEATPYVGVAGDPFYKPVQGAFGDARCLAVPLAEVDANPNFP